jgi:hypothetical protein
MFYYIKVYVLYSLRRVCYYLLYLLTSQTYFITLYVKSVLLSHVVILVYITGLSYRQTILFQLSPFLRAWSGYWEIKNYFSIQHFSVQGGYKA